MQTDTSVTWNIPTIKKHIKLPAMTHPEGEVTSTRRNVGDYSSSDTASHRRRVQSSNKVLDRPITVH